MNITEKAEQMLGSVAKWRIHLWEEHHVRDAPPTLGWLVNGEDAFDHAPPELLHRLYREAGDDDTPSVIYSVLRSRAEEQDFPGFREIVFVTDSFGYDGSAPPPDHLETDFNTNPASQVREQVTIVVVADDLVGGVEVAVGLQPYRVTDGGQMVFDEPEVIGPDSNSHKVDSDIVECMKWGVMHGADR